MLTIDNGTIVIMNCRRTILPMRVLYILLIGPAVCFVQNEPTSHRERHVRYAEASTMLPSVNTGTVNPDDLNVKFTMREAENYDTSTVIGFLDQLRDFHDKLLDDDTARSTAPLIKEGDTIQSLMPQIRNCHVVLAQPKIQCINGSYCSEPIGFASYHLKYSGFGPPLLHMEHLFVNPSCRSQGAGLALMNELSNIGKQFRCSHMEWSVHKENVRGVEFYHRIGAVSNTNADPHQQLETDSVNFSHDGTSNTMKWIPAAWNL